MARTWMARLPCMIQTLFSNVFNSYQIDHWEVPVPTATDDILIFLFLFFFLQKISIDISCELSE